MTTDSVTEYQALVRDTPVDTFLAEFPDLEPLAARVGSSSSNSSHTKEDMKIFAGHDEEQIRLMDEACICVDYDDKPYAAGSKKTLHKMSSINKGLLHRAFSVFLFNKKGELLLQQRASEKITFADQWTNTCCSHPLATPTETGDNLPASIVGVKNAAIRKLEHELGIKDTDVPFDDFKFLTRIHYMAPSSDTWGEHEVDYILFIDADPTVDANPNEVRDWQWVSRDKLEKMLEDPSLSFTPWFKLICNEHLFRWWGNVPKESDDQIIRMF